VKVSAQESAEFQAFRRRCRYDVFIQKRIQYVQDQAVVGLADDYGFKITVADLRGQRRRVRRDRRREVVRADRTSGLVSRLSRQFRRFFSFRLHRPS
jgi:hypothetical protein